MHVCTYLCGCGARTPSMVMNVGAPEKHRAMSPRRSARRRRPHAEYPTQTQQTKKYMFTHIYIYIYRERER